MSRRIALLMVASVVVLAHATSAQSRSGATTTPGGHSSRAQTNTPPPPPQPPPPTQAPVRPIVGALVPLSPPGLIPIGVSQLPSTGVVQTFTPASVDRRFGARRSDGRFVDGRFSNDVFRAGRFTYAPQYGNRGYGGYGSIVGGYYDATIGTAGLPDQDARAAASVAFGYLRLNVQPFSAQVFVDGLYVSTVDAFNGGGPARALEAGAHRIEIRADGYETATFDVRIDPNETTTYRRDLSKTEAPQQARSVAPAIPKTFYVIPKCYAGDKKPSADQLPKGCQALNVRVIPPAVTPGPQDRTRPTPTAN